MPNTLLVPNHRTLTLPAEEDTMKLGAAVAELTQPGDVIALKGVLGAGKTTFARGFIQHLAGANEEVVSPTFTLVQTYETARAPVWHFDLYRIDNPDEVIELGLEDAQAEGISLIEWPERLGPHAPHAPLEIEISSVIGKSARNARLSGQANWRSRLNELVGRVQ
jgi:tRNA threonylcarbamoyladenosine biosynthesis protein TsaE